MAASRERPSAGRPVSSVDNTAVFSRLSPADHCHPSLPCEYICQIQVTKTEIIFHLNFTNYEKREQLSKLS